MEKIIIGWQGGPELGRRCKEGFMFNWSCDLSLASLLVNVGRDWKWWLKMENVWGEIEITVLEQK